MQTITISVPLKYALGDLYTYWLELHLFVGGPGGYCHPNLLFNNSILWVVNTVVPGWNTCMFLFTKVWFVCLSVCMYVHTYVCMSICLSVCLSLFFVRFSVVFPSVSSLSACFSSSRSTATTWTWCCHWHVPMSWSCPIFEVEVCKSYRYSVLHLFVFVVSCEIRHGTM